MSCQQFELYDSERGAIPSESIPASSLQAYVDSLRESTYWERNFSQVVRIEAFTRPPSAQAKGSVGSWHPELSAGKIEMADCHLTEQFILHEVAHVLAAARYGSMSHDPWFARTYLELVYTYIGSDAYAALAASFDAAGIDHNTDNTVPAGTQL